MPKLKQPESLQKMTEDILVKFVVEYCHRLSVNGSIDLLRRGISIIKIRVFNYIPWQLLADFSTRFIDEFYSNERPSSHHKAALEMLMDMEIVNLRCKGPIVAHLDPEDAHRFRRLEELDLSYFPHTASIDLKNFHLDDIETFIFPIKCTDDDLKVIGTKCSKLQVLKIQKSAVTDEGLRALNLCSELRVVDIVDCPVSHNGINRFLSEHKQIEEFAYWDGTGHPDGCDILSNLDSSVCPSMNRFFYKYDRDNRFLDLKTIVAKFPNLTYLRIESADEEDLSVLRFLDKLAGLEIHFVHEMYYDEVEETWESLKALLTFIGANIISLELSCWDLGFFWGQEEINFIFQTCPNVENLALDQGGDLIVIPPFKKLKKFFPRIDIEFEQIEILEDPALEFGILSNLETLSVINYGMNVQALESIILDDVKFPNLSVIETNCLKPEELEQIKRTVRNHNLDLEIKYDPESNWYIEYKFGEKTDSDDN